MLLPDFFFYLLARFRDGHIAPIGKFQTFLRFFLTLCFPKKTLETFFTSWLADIMIV